VIRWLLLVACLPALAAEPLPRLKAEARGVTVSGLSSGGSMAVQMHVAHSASVSGAGIFAGAPYYCAQASLATALYNCMTPGSWTPVPAAAQMKSRAEQFEKARWIDPLANLKGAPVWLFSGAEDRTVLPAVVRELRRFYELQQAKVVLLDNQPVGHALPREMVGEMLKHLLGVLHAPSTATQGKLLAVDQAYLFVPKDCESGGCRVHVAFHGCGQAGESFAREAGYNSWADTNRLVVLYPQVGKSYSPLAFNPYGCWDWWGYTGANYATRDGAQVKAVKAMLERLAQSPRRSPPPRRPARRSALRW
jgi:poly(3-hydroxybutyrate) depolymerase